MQAKELDPLLEMLEKRLPTDAGLRETVKDMMGACVSDLKWEEVHNPEFELPAWSVAAYEALKAFVVERESYSSKKSNWFHRIQRHAGRGQDILPALPPEKILRKIFCGGSNPNSSFKFNLAAFFRA